MRQAAARSANLVVWVEAAERNMSAGDHRVMIMCVEEHFSTPRLRRQECLRHIKYPKALSPSNRRPFARQRNCEASLLSRPRVDDAFPDRAFRPQPLPLRGTFYLCRRFALLVSATANARRP